MIATSDIAEVAARALRQLDFKGFVARELLGERDLTMREVTRILGERIGKLDLRYVRTSSSDFIEELLQMGLSQNFAEDVEHAFSGLNENRSRSREGRRPENMTPTRFETFANLLATRIRRCDPNRRGRCGSRSSTSGFLTSFVFYQAADMRKPDFPRINLAAKHRRSSTATKHCSNRARLSSILTMHTPPVPCGAKDEHARLGVWQTRIGC
jgi:hypothetical protein